MKLFLKIIVSIVIIFILVGAGGIFFLSRGLEAGVKVDIQAVKLSSLKDGVYRGEYKAGRWSNQVNVTVKDHKITEINIVKDVTFPKPEWTQQILDRVVKEQNTDIDVISGATVTSKAYLKAIENALNK